MSDLTKKEKKIKTENLLQVEGRGEEQNTKNYKKKDDLKASHLLTAPPLVKRPALISCLVV